MSFSGIPIWVYVFLIWYACGIWAVGALFAGMIWDRTPFPTTGRHWILVFALLGLPLLLYVWLACKDLGKGFVITEYGARRLAEKVERHYDSRYKLQRR